MLLRQGGDSRSSCDDFLTLLVCMSTAVQPAGHSSCKWSRVSQLDVSGGVPFVMLS